MGNFKDELNQNTKTLEEVENEKWLIESEKIIIQAESDFKYIKSQLLSKAKSGEYLTIGDKKHIYFNYESKYLSQCIEREDQSTHTRKLFGGREFHGRVAYEIKDVKIYNLYLSTLKNMASEDDIVITPIFIEKYMSKSNSINLPYVYNGPYSIMHEVKIHLKCYVDY